MSFLLPPNFKERVNEIDTQLTMYEQSVNKTERKTALRSALVKSCAFLKTLNLPELKTEIERVLKQADPKWTTIITCPSHFEYFLSHVEGRLLERIGLKEHVRTRILNELRATRELFKNPPSNSDESIAAIKRLRDDICRESDRLVKMDMSMAKLEEMGKKVTKVFGVIVIAADAVAPLYLPDMSTAGAAASIAVGNLAQWLK